MKDYKLFCDGAYSTSRDQGGIGIIILNENDEVVTQYNHAYKNTTNSKMELVAVITGIRSIKKPIDSLTIYTDSQYVIGCATLGWKRTANIKYWEYFDHYMHELKKLCPKVRFTHVKGHQKDDSVETKMNNRCDSLAVYASHEV